MHTSSHIAVDVMGGDFGPRLCVPATLKFHRTHPELQFSLVGRKAEILSCFSSDIPSQFSIVDVDQVVEADERAGSALRYKRESSMWRALTLVADGTADACVSGGNTGALMAMGRRVVGTLAGMSRPAICKPMPSASGQCFVLDLGANLDCSPEMLVQFAVMGDALARLAGVDTPRVALLNVGAEHTKGHPDIRKTDRLLAARQDLNYCGFVEGNQLYDGSVDVIVCDGFVGNVALKVSEGAARFMLDTLRHQFSGSVWRRALGGVQRLVLKPWRDRFNPSFYNGAALLGLKKIVIKSHGSADETGFYYALDAARQQIEAEIPRQLAARL